MTIFKYWIALMVIVHLSFNSTVQAFEPPIPSGNQAIEPTSEGDEGPQKRQGFV